MVFFYFKEIFLVFFYLYCGQFLIKKTTQIRVAFLFALKSDYFFAFALEVETFLLEEAVFFVEEDLLQQDLVAFEP